MSKSNKASTKTPAIPTKTSMTDQSAAEEEVHITQASKDLSDKTVRAFLRKYFYVSNDLSLEKEWGDLFTEDGTYIMGSRKATGRPGILSPSLPPSLPIIITTTTVLLAPEFLRLTIRWYDPGSDYRPPQKTMGRDPPPRPQPLQDLQPREPRRRHGAYDTGACGVGVS
ncbi:MAG: hypothetical protein Q9222_007464 [Ikaeria aurantiellina]